VSRLVEAAVLVAAIGLWWTALWLVVGW